MFVITDSLVPFVRELLGGMSQGPAQSPCNSSRCLMGFCLFSVVLTRLCCPGIRDELQSSAELSTGWTRDEDKCWRVCRLLLVGKAHGTNITHSLSWFFFGGWDGFFQRLRSAGIQQRQKEQLCFLLSGLTLVQWLIRVQDYFFFCTED